MVSGEYYRVFGMTYLDEDYSCETNDVSKNSAFLHERIHFIQNISMRFGLNTALLHMSRYLGYILQIQEGKLDYVPFKGNNQENISILIDMASGEYSGSQFTSCPVIGNRK